MKRWLWLLLVLVPSWCWADIELKESYKLGESVIATVTSTGIPENAIIRGSLTLVGPNKSTVVQRGSEYMIWAEPGTYSVNYRGMWVQTDTGELGGKLIDFNLVEYTAPLTIEGEPSPDPPPPPPPPPPVGPYQLMFFYEGDKLDNYPQAQRNLITSLALRNRLVSQGHVVLEMVEAKALDKPAPDRYRTFFDAVRGKTMPRLAFAPKEGGELREVPLPANEAELNELLKSVVLRKR